MFTRIKILSCDKICIFRGAWNFPNLMQFNKTQNLIFIEESTK